MTLKSFLEDYNYSYKLNEKEFYYLRIENWINGDVKVLITKMEKVINRSVAKDYNDDKFTDDFDYVEYIHTDVYKGVINIREMKRIVLNENYRMNFVNKYIL